MGGGNENVDDRFHHIMSSGSVGEENKYCMTF